MSRQTIFIRFTAKYRCSECFKYSITQPNLEGRSTDWLQLCCSTIYNQTYSLILLYVENMLYLTCIFKPCPDLLSQFYVWCKIWAEEHGAKSPHTWFEARSLYGMKCLIAAYLLKALNIYFFVMACCISSAGFKQSRQQWHQKVVRTNSCVLTKAMLLKYYLPLIVNISNWSQVI